MNLRKLFPTLNFIITDFRWRSSNVLKIYNRRGTAEKQVLGWRAMFMVCQNGREKRPFDVNAWPFCCFLWHGMLNLAEYC